MASRSHAFARAIVHSAIHGAALTDVLFHFVREAHAEAAAILRLVDWRVFLVLPAATLLLITSPWIEGAELLGNKAFQEIAAAGLALAMFVAFIIRVLLTRAPFATILAVIAFAFFVREIHFEGSETLIRILLPLCLIWTWRWREKVRESLRDPRLMTWLVLSIATYAYSQVCARRGFGFLPNERTLHEPLEEGMENLAHIFMLGTAMVGSWKRRG
jgi:hypothetical protein